MQEVQLLSEQNEELLAKNEDLVELIKILDNKMSKFEQYILDEVSNGEEELHNLIHTSATQTLVDNLEAAGESIQFTSLSLKISMLTKRESM